MSTYQQDITDRITELEAELDELYAIADAEEEAEGSASLATARAIGDLEGRVAKLYRVLRMQAKLQTKTTRTSGPTRRQARAAEAVAKAARPMRLAPGRSYRSC